MMNTQKPTNVEIERFNRASVYRYFFSRETATKQELVADLGLCLPTVSKNLAALCEAGLIGKSGSVGNTGGRRAATWSLLPDARIALGMDITMNHLTVVAVNLTGSIVASARRRLKFAEEEGYYREAGQKLERLVSEAGIVPQQILGVGVGLPALVDKDDKSLIFSKILPLRGTIFEEISAHIPYEVRLYNDANAAAFTESWQGPPIRNLFYLMLSNNVGGAMILEGAYYPGDTQKSSEVGHMTLVPNGRPCYCGQKGCADAYLSATNLAALAGGSLQSFFDRLDEGDSAIAGAWDEYLDYLALTVNSVHALLDCDVILGGYVGEHMEAHLPRLRQKAAARNTFGAQADYLKACSYKRESIAAGAALHFIDSFIRSI